MAIMFNGHDLTDGFAVYDLKRPMPEFRPSSTLVEGADGEMFSGVTVGTRDVLFTIAAYDKGMRALQDAARQLMRIFAVREPKDLTLSDEVDGDGVQLVRHAVPLGAFDAQEFMRAGQWTCRFVMHDPYLYGKGRSAVLRANTVQTVDAGGNAEAWPIAVAKPTGSSYTVQAVSGPHVQFTAPFSSGNTLKLDFGAQKAVLTPANANAGGLQVGSEFFPLEGRMRLHATHETTITWTERWL